MLGDALFQFRQAEEDHAEEIAIVELEIQQHPQVFEDRLVPDRVGLIPPRLVVCHEAVGQGTEERGPMGSLRRDIQLPRNFVQQLLRGEGGVDHEADVILLLLELRKEDTAQGALPAPDLPREQGPSLSVLDHVDELLQDLPMGRNGAEEGGIGHVLERGPAESPIRLVHLPSLIRHDSFPRSEHQDAPRAIPPSGRASRG